MKPIKETSILGDEDEPLIPHAAEAKGKKRNQVEIEANQSFPFDKNRIIPKVTEVASKN